MSYCRFSSMNWKSDVYVYADVMGGWTTHVASRKRAIPPIPGIPIHKLPRLNGKWDKELRKVVYPNRRNRITARILYGFTGFWHRRVHMASLRLIPLRPIGLAHDGESFNDETPGECADRLERLRAMGYQVPEGAIQALREEEAEENQQGEGGYSFDKKSPA